MPPATDSRGLFNRLKTLYTGTPEPEIPPISTGAAIAILVAYTLVYVVPFYISSTTRPSASLSRDAPSVIRGRIASVTVSCIICSVTTFVVLAAVDDGDAVSSPLKALHRLGYLPVGLVESGRALLLTAILFMGPLFEAGIVEGRWRGWIRLQGLDAVVSGWIGYRNMVAGPITEEILFRSAAVPLFLTAQTSNTTIIFLTPIIFGLAHVHHFYEFRLTHPHTPLVAALLRTLLQFTYTTLFGGYATFLFLRTGSLLSAILVHAFCNWMGFPRFWGRVNMGKTIIGPDLGEGKRDDRSPQTENGQLNIVWTLTYYSMLVVGALSWWKLIWTLTDSDLALSKF